MKEVLDLLIQSCNRSTRRSLSLPEPAFALDSTTVTVGEGCLPWARFRGEKSGAKLHVRLDLSNEALAQVETSLARIHDSAIAPQLLNTPQTVTVQDRGYVDFKRMEAMDTAGVHFVVRLRKTTFIQTGSPCVGGPLKILPSFKTTPVFLGNLVAVFG